MKKKLISLFLLLSLSSSLLTGCGDSNGQGEADNQKSDAADLADQELPTLRVGNMGTSIKAAMTVLASEMGYYEEEGVPVVFENISDLNAGLTAISADKLDILPMGIIPTVTFASQGSDFVIFAGTISEGSQAVVTAENADSISDITDFSGKTVACVRPETGHMIAEDLMRQAGVDVDTQVNFVELDGFQSVIEAVSKGEADAGFVNSGFGQVAESQGLIVAMNVGDLAPNAVCCRQTTSQAVIDAKEESLVRYLMANLRAYQLYLADSETAIDKLMTFSGQSREYVEYCLYADVMIISLDPATSRVQDFYKVMVNNGDIAEDSQWNIDKNANSTLYQTALENLAQREPSETLWQQLLEECQENNP